MTKTHKLRSHRQKGTGFWGWRNYSTLCFCALVSLYLTGAGCHRGGQAQKKLGVVATTSLIGGIVETIGREEVRVVTIVPAGMCPGHFDIKPGDVRVLENAGLLLEHGFEGEGFLGDMLELIESPRLLKITIGVKGNWMVPDVQIKAVEKIVEALSRVDSGNASLFKSRARDYKLEIAALAGQIQQEAGEVGVGQVKVICSKMQAGFVDWFGFDIVATYGRPEDFTPGQIRDLIREARLKDVRLVVDNLQSGSKAGLPIAREIRVPHVVLTNFPQEHNGKLSYRESLKENVSKLIQVLKK